MSKRARRRHNTQRMKDKFIRMEKLFPYWTSDESSFGDREVGAGIFANHGCSCSCNGCGNPRKHYRELTIQERRNIEDFNYSVNNLE